MQYECGCYFGPEDPWEPTCPIHQMPMKLNEVCDADIAWALDALTKHGYLSEEVE